MTDQCPTGPKPIRTAVIGVGYLGSFHSRVYSELPDVQLRYLVDSDPARAAKLAAEYGGQARTDHRQILRDVDAVSIVTPTSRHYEIARDFLDAGVSVLVEKPMTTTVAEADELIRLAQARGATLQVGHIERFNPAYLAIRGCVCEPVFIECHRLSPYSFRSTDVSVVLDLMIHDLDLILDAAGAQEAASIEAAGVPVFSKGTDIANARLRFDSQDGRPGCIANVTASRISPRPMRRLRVFQRDAYISMDFLDKKVSIFRKKEGFDLAKAGCGPPAELASTASSMEKAPNGPEGLAPGKLPRELGLGQLLDIRHMDLERSDALKDELTSFINAVRQKTPPLVTGEHGRRALALAVAIEEEIQRFIAARSSQA